MSTAPRLASPTTLPWLSWLAFLAWMAFIVCFFHPGSAGFSWVGKQPWGDKCAHVLLIGTAAFLFDRALSRRRVRLGFLRVPLAGLIVAVGMTAEEVSQIWMPGRNIEWEDLVANYLGIALAWLAAIR